MPIQLRKYAHTNAKVCPYKSKSMRIQLLKYGHTFLAIFNSLEMNELQFIKSSKTKKL
ncbi:hypothetical protein [uncultured Lutibacter sp.]|uniref:hypothetical protein n=1 Tax=uncultured Lutibacter sp. TaxID=437739 RepID=UPI002628BCD3|nr:hypothetical protein [uncultured Lutibacter sp.]